MGLVTTRDRLCVVQLCDRSGRATLVQIPRAAHDPKLAKENRAPRLKRLLEDPGVLKVLHFARFDVAAVKHYLGIRMAPIYCTRTASKLVRTYTDRHGLKDCALELLDIEMDKAARHTDWSSATLSKEQVRYAISDVTFLLPKDKPTACCAGERTELAQPASRDPVAGGPRRPRLLQLSSTEQAKDDEAARARVEQFVRDHWVPLASFAWRAYRKQGRGGLLIDWRAIQASEADETGTLMPHYVTYTEVERLGRLFASYDPERAIVIAVAGGDPKTRDVAASEGAPAMKIIRADASFRAWVFDGDPPPPLAMASTAH
jgi:ribonuclease D